MMADTPPRRARLSERHVQQRAKNWLVLGIVLGLCVLFFAMTVVQYGGAGVLPGLGK